MEAYTMDEKYIHAMIRDLFKEFRTQSNIYEQMKETIPEKVFDWDKAQQALMHLQDLAEITGTELEEATTVKKKQLVVLFVTGGIVNDVAPYQSRAEIEKDLIQQEFVKGGQDGDSCDDYWDTSRKGGGYEEAIIWEIEVD